MRGQWSNDYGMHDYESPRPQTRTDFRMYPLLRSLVQIRCGIRRHAGLRVHRARSSYNKYRGWHAEFCAGGRPGAEGPRGPPVGDPGSGLGDVPLPHRQRPGSLLAHRG
ncbi:unnamed protein product [Ectocarpus sp. 8 AP-2014]